MDVHHQLTHLLVDTIPKGKDTHIQTTYPTFLQFQTVIQTYLWCLICSYYDYIFAQKLIRWCQHAVKV